MRDEEVDVGGNRPIDYELTLEQFEICKAKLDSGVDFKFDELSRMEIATLRQMAHDLGIISDVVDHKDRYHLIRSLFYYRKWANELLDEISTLQAKLAVASVGIK